MDRVMDLENCREKNEVKVCRKEKVAISAKRFMVLDIDFSKEIMDNVAQEKMMDKIRSDKKARYDQVLARATVKRKQ